MSEVCARAGACVRSGEGARSEGASSDSAGLGSPIPQPRLSAGATDACDRLACQGHSECQLQIDAIKVDGI